MSKAAPRPLWGWILPSRVLLGVMAVVGSLGLLALAHTCARPTVPAARLVLDVNSAPPVILEALPRLGPVLVGRIVEARAQAPFQSLEDLDLRVKGIGPATIAALRPYLRCEPSRR